jgi:thioredoxin 1
MSDVKTIDDSTFDENVIRSSQPVLVEFTAEWCGPCHQMIPILDIYSDKNSTVKILKVNIDESPDSVSKYGVKNVPTFVLFDGGAVIGTKIGSCDFLALDSFVTEKLNK